MAEKYISQFTGQEIDERLASVSQKYGHIDMRFDEQQSMYYMDCYTSKQDFTDGEEPLESVLIPISTKQGTSYTAFLTGNIGNTVDLVVAEGKLEVFLNYRAIQITEAGNINANAQGTVVVQRKTATTDWTTVGVIEDTTLPSSEPTDTITTTKVDVGGFLTKGKQSIRLQAVYTITDEETGEEKTVRSGYVMVGQSVNFVELRLQFNRDYWTPVNAVNVNGEANKFPVDYIVYGTVQKTLHVEIYGSTGTYTLHHELAASFDSRPTENLGVDDIDGYGLLTHGVHKITAWLTCNDGLGDVITSPKLVNRLMVYNVNATEEERMKPKLMLQDIDVVGSTVENFVQKNICNYAVYSPKKNADGTITNEGDAIAVVFMLTSYTEDYETQKPDTEYYRLEINVPPAQKNELLTTVEIESETVQNSYETYFRARRVSGDTDTDFIKESTNEEYYPVAVDNSRSFAPISGATFLLNPKVRNNSEDNPEIIYNAANKNAVVKADFINFGFINDGWVTASDNQKVLRIMAGEKLRLYLNPLKQYATTPASSMTMVIDYKISNVTDENTPVINLSETNGSTFKGLRMNALGGWIKPASQTNDDNLFFGWQEDVRTQMILNINHAVRPNKGDVQYPSTYPESTVNGSIALARVMINGTVEREVPFSTTDKAEWCTNTDNCLEIGNEGADIDIYSIRIYEDKQLEARNLYEKNYISSLPTSEEKVAEREKNDLIENDRINLDKTRKKGLNCYVWHGKTPYHEETATQRGWLEIFRYDDEGNYLPEFSGTICKESKMLPLDGQGSTAKTYWDWNLQDKVKDAEAKIWVALEKFHESIHIRLDEANGKAYIYGGNLGKYEPIAPKEKAYNYADGMIEVPDGWVDGNGKYRGMGYQVAAGTAQSLKNNLKINYASSMQSHLIGACKAYNLLHQAVAGKNSIQEQYPAAVTAKMLEPFMVFVDGGDGAIFKGMGVYGAAKADKVAWGYVEDLHPMFAMVEGSDNNLPLTDFRVPFDHKVIPVLDKDGEMEGWSYAGKVSYDYDMGSLSDDGTEAAPAIRKKWSEIHNYIYLHAPNLKYFKGTFAQFKQSAEAKSGLNHKYWCTDSTDGKWYLYRYDWVDEEWVDAGLWSDTLGAYKPIELKTNAMTKATYDAALNSGTSTNYAEMNRLFNMSIVGHGKDFLHYFYKEKSLKFNYCFTLGLIAGTDNSSKNTYHVIDPKARTVEDGAEFGVNATFSAWFLDNFGYEFDYTGIYQVEEHGDDMDSIFSTNNNANLTKPYYIDRMHPYKDDNEANGSLYEGMGNALFNFCELAYEDSKELQSTMHSIMDAMCNLVGADDKIYGKITTKQSVWGFFHKYFFNIQHYFPKIAYIEQNRIRYEFPELLGFVSSGDGARSIAPITQALGSQLENEQQFLNRRLIYFASYAAFGALGKDGDIGIPDATDSQNWVPANLPDGNPADYVLTLTPHQYIYPTAFIGTTVVDHHVRVAAGKSYAFTVATNVSGSDTGMGIKGANYYSNYGNLGTLSTTGALTINGKRLKVYNANSNHFRPQSILFEARNLKEITVGAPRYYAISIDLSKQIRLEVFRAMNYVEKVIFPETHSLKRIAMSSTFHEISIKNAPNLSLFDYSTLYAAYYDSLKTFEIGENVGTNTGLSVQSIVESLYKKAPLETLIVKNIGNPSEDKGWSDLDANVMEWLADIPTCELKGTISIKEDDPYGNPRITWDLKNKINAKFGFVDIPSSPYNRGLNLIYKQKDFNPDGASIRGNFYVEAGNVFAFNIKPSSVYENSQYLVQFSFSKTPSKSSANITTKGQLTVNSLSSSYDECTIKVVVECFTGRYTHHELFKTIEIWNRPAQIGDLVYADGTFSSAETWEGEKTPIGICFYVPPRDDDGNVLTKFANPNDTQLRLMAALEETVVPINGDLRWGAQLQDSSQTEEWNQQNALYHLDTEGNRVNLTSASGKVTSIYDIQDVRNLTSRGLDNSYIDPLRVPKEGEAPFDYLDDSDEASFNYGFKCIAPNMTMGDGFAYNESQVSFNSVGERTLTSELAKLAGSGYKEGDIVNSGYAKTLKVIAHRNALLSNNIIGADGEVIYTGKTFSAPSADGSTTEMKALGTLIDQLRNWAANENGLNDPYPEKWQQLAYPFASACYAYQPTQDLEEGEVLADKFKAHNWFAPTEGLLARICWYAKFAPKVGNDPFKVAREKGLLRILTTTSSAYHSVTETSNLYSWYVNFYNGDTGNRHKSNRLFGFAVSAF